MNGLSATSKHGVMKWPQFEVADRIGVCAGLNQLPNVVAVIGEGSQVEHLASECADLGDVLQLVTDDFNAAGISAQHLLKHNTWLASGTIRVAPFFKSVAESISSTYHSGNLPNTFLISLRAPADFNALTISEFFI
ncbi:hypothetical protein ACQUJT_17305 [Ralstonia pseudosolanacearum]